MPLVGFTKNVGGWPLSAASSARLAFRIVMVAFEAWLKGWRSGMIRTPKRNVESSNLAGTSELDVILAHVFLVEVRGRGIWSRAGEQVKICPYHLRLDFLASEFQVVFLALSISHIIRCRTMISSRLSSPAKVSFTSGDLVHWSHLSHVSLYQSWIAVLASSPQVACFPAIHPGKTGQGLSLGKWVLLRYGPSGDPSDPVCNALWNLT
jgi:hypothetical protein